MVDMIFLRLGLSIAAFRMPGHGIWPCTQWAWFRDDLSSPSPLRLTGLTDLPMRRKTAEMF